MQLLKLLNRAGGLNFNMSPPPLLPIFRKSRYFFSSAKPALLRFHMFVIMQRLFLFFLLIFCASNIRAQLPDDLITGPQRNKTEREGKQKVFVTAGPELSLTIPTQFGSDHSRLASDTLFSVSPLFRFRFGLGLRLDFSAIFSFQTGIYYISRRNEISIGKTSGTNQQFDQIYYQQGINYIGYEIPLMALVYARLGERTFLNNALGISLDFFPSSAQRSNPEEEFTLYIGRNSWFVPSLKASVGFECRTNHSGYLYFGGNFHQPIVALADIFIERTGPTGPIGFQTQVIPMSGTYFSLDFKYFFPPGKKNQWIR